MDNKREVNWSVFYGLLKEKGPLAFMGVIFTFLSVAVITPLTLFLSVTLKQPYEKYDFNNIQKNGIEKTAKVTFIQSMTNVSVNGQNPKLISYEYDNNGQTISDKFETFDLEKTADFSVGSNAEILSYNNQSVIKGLKPFSFPFGVFFILPAIFLIIGLVFLFIGFFPALKKFNLYKNGVIKEANIISIVSDTGGGLTVKGWRQNFLVNYYFPDEFGQKIFGKSTTKDLLILNEKKAGDTIKIFVDESDNGKSCLVPKLEAMKYNWSI